MCGQVAHHFSRVSAMREHLSRAVAHMQSQWKDVQKLLAKQLLALQGLLRDYDRRTSATVSAVLNAATACRLACAGASCVLACLPCACGAMVVSGAQEELHALLCSGAASGAVSQFLQSTLNATVRCVAAWTAGLVRCTAHECSLASVVVRALTRACRLDVANSLCVA